MQITRQIEVQGNWLFRWRSYLPLLSLPLLIVELAEYQRPFHSEGLHRSWSMFCLAISLIGLIVRCLTAAHAPGGTSGRNVRCQVAEQLNTLGLYSIVRHPLYLGNLLIGLGIFLAPFHGALTIIDALAFCLYYERIIAAEEIFLENRFKAEFVNWVAKTPAFLPNFSLWKSASLPFSLRTLLRREYTGLLVVVAFHAGVETIKNQVLSADLLVEPFWMIAFSVTALIYLALRAMKKHTQLLLVHGR